MSDEVKDDLIDALYSCKGLLEVLCGNQDEIANIVIEKAKKALIKAQQE
jgi:hypothetical protein